MLVYFGSICIQSHRMQTVLLCNAKVCNCMNTGDVLNSLFFIRQATTVFPHH